MIYEAAYNTALGPVRDSYPWARTLPQNEKARKAIEMGDAILLGEALTQGADLHNPQRPLLVEAALRAKPTLALYLVDRGARVNFPNSLGESAVFGAAQVGDFRLLRFLLECGGDPDQADRWQNTPLMQAVFHGHLHCLPLLIENGADLQARNEKDESVVAQARSGRAAMEWKRRKSLRLQRDLLNRRAISREEFDEHLALDFEGIRALDEQYGEIRRFLLENGAIDCGSPVEFLTLPKKPFQKKAA